MGFTFHVSFPKRALQKFQRNIGWLKIEGNLMVCSGFHSTVQVELTVKFPLWKFRSKDWQTSSICNLKRCRSWGAHPAFMCDFNFSVPVLRCVVADRVMKTKWETGIFLFFSFLGVWTPHLIIKLRLLSGWCHLINYLRPKKLKSP